MNKLYMSRIVQDIYASTQQNLYRSCTGLGFAQITSWLCALGASKPRNTGKHIVDLVWFDKLECVL